MWVCNSEEGLIYSMHHQPREMKAEPWRCQPLEEDRDRRPQRRGEKAVRDWWLGQVNFPTQCAQCLNAAKSYKVQMESVQFPEIWFPWPTIFYKLCTRVLKLH
jgi:hypothetical protein